MKKIQLTKNKFTIVDDFDYEWLNKNKWQFGARGYAIRNAHLRMENGKRKIKSI